MKRVIGIIIGIIGAVLSVVGLILKVKGKVSVSIIGGADGPTSIFLAGKTSGDASVCAIIIGIILLIIAGFICFRRKR